MRKVSRNLFIPGIDLSHCSGKVAFRCWTGHIAGAASPNGFHIGALARFLM